MASRAIGTGTISFGLVSIPVKLYSTNQPASTVSFNILHRACGTRLRQQMICPTDNVVVERDQQAKGYEFAKGQFVVFADDELKALEEQGSEVIDITEFVPADQVDPVYFEKAYYLGPEKGADRAYNLLREVMKQTGRVALARYAARGKQYLVMLRPAPGEVGLVMQQLRYADEVKPFSEVPIETGAKAMVKDHELKLAKQLVNRIASPSFQPEKYEDDVKKRTQELIARKVEGEQITSVPNEEPQAKIIDLMEALKASLAAAKSEDASGDKKPAKRAPGSDAAAAAATEEAAAPAVTVEKKRKGRG